METIELNHLNSALRLSGSEKRRGITIETITVKKWPEAGENLKLLIIDEKEITIYSQPFSAAQREEEQKIVIHKTFNFYDHLTVKVEAESGDSPFAVEVAFE